MKSSGCHQMSGKSLDLVTCLGKRRAGFAALLFRSFIACFFLSLDIIYRLWSKFLDRHVWASSVDPDQTVPRSSLISVYTVYHSVCIIWTHYSVVKWYCSNYRIITAILWVSKFELQHDKTNKMSVCPAKTQVSLGICPVWSESSLCTQ